MKGNRQIRRDAKKLFHLCLAEGELDVTRVLEVVGRISGSTYRGRVALLRELHRLVKPECDRRTAEIASAVPLPGDLRKRITSDLEHVYGLGLQIRFVEKPELIGGVRVMVGSDVYDDSIRYRLALLERSFSATNGL
ncbi:MAG: F0F1 ATP synthase subunit delta [Acidobacteriota bacterium]|jgi:F-type H+-transporting ATPase subunit delta